MEIETLCLPNVIEASRFGDLDYFVRRTAFVICHKSEPLETLLTVLRYLPAEGARIIVTNCPPSRRLALREELARHVAPAAATYLVHQKDDRIARVFQESGVSQILDASGHVADGKGEGMYVGALVAALLGTPEWLVYFDADNHAPSALLEYTLAMGHLFMTASTAYAPMRSIPHAHDGHAARAPLHNVRVCWASKPAYDGETFVPQPRTMGRCTQVIAPLCDALLGALRPGDHRPLLTPNAGEQGMTMATARALRFSGGFSIETFQLLELLFLGARGSSGAAPRTLLQQYLSGSPHFHQKKDDSHIQGMIAESLGSFLAFRRQLPLAVTRRVAHLAGELGVPVRRPVIYPALGRLPLARYAGLAERFRLDIGDLEPDWRYALVGSAPLDDPRASA